MYIYYIEEMLLKSRVFGNGGYNFGQYNFAKKWQLSKKCTDTRGKILFGK